MHRQAGVTMLATFYETIKSEQIKKYVNAEVSIIEKQGINDKNNVPKSSMR
jgi:hypothetical protein